MLLVGGYQSVFVTAWGAKDARPSAESPKSLGRQETTGMAAPRRRRVARARQEAGAPFLPLMSLPSRLANLSYAQLLEIAQWTLFCFQQELSRNGRQIYMVEKTHAHLSYGATNATSQ